MGSADNANNLLHYWIGQHRPDFHPEATSSVEATVAHSLRELATDLGICTCKLLVTPRLQNNYGGLNGGCMAALTCIMAAAALETVAARSGIVTSSSIDCLSAMPGDAIVEVIARVAAVTNASASVNVSLQDAISHKLVAKGRYTEQAPHTIRARASAYLTTAASAARSAVHRLQAVAESALQRADSTTGSQSNQAGSDQSQDIKHKAMASLANAGATVRAAAHRLQVAADSVLHSSSADLQHGQTDTADNNIESTEGGDEGSADSPMTEIASRAFDAARTAAANVQYAARTASANVQAAASTALDRGQAAASAASDSSQAAAQSTANAKSSLQSQQPGQTQESGTGSSESDSQGAVPSTGNSPAPERAKQALLQRIAMVKDSYCGDDCSCFDTTVGCMLKDIKVDKGKCSAVLPTSAPLSDQQGHLHAGCYCSLVDLISTTALAAADKRPAVTVTISVDFYAPLAIGEDLEVESHMVKAGKTLTFAEVNFRQRSSGELIAQGSHVEYSAGGAAYPDTIEEYHKSRVARHTSKL